MSEQTMWDRVRDALVQGPRDEATRVENPAWPGTPDVSYCMRSAEGWLELKQITSWPVKRDTVVQVSHFTPQQRAWLRKRRQAGGRAFLLLKVQEDWLLFWGEMAANIVGKVPKPVLLAKAVLVCEGGLRDDDLRNALRMAP